MAVSLADVIKTLTPEQRTRVKIRAAELIAEEVATCEKIVVGACRLVTADEALTAVITEGQAVDDQAAQGK